MKICTLCKTARTREEFYFRRVAADNLSSWCIACSKARKTQWRIKNTARIAAYMQSYRQQNKDSLKAQTIAYRKANAEKVARTSALYKAANKDKVKKWHSDWQKANAAYCQARNWERWLARERAVPKWANHFFIEEAYDLAARRTKLQTGGHAEWHVDHIVPLTSKLVCGLHTHDNLRVITALENMRKKNKYWPQMP